MNRFEKLIEYVINDEEQKARELFHDIVVEKSRQIYENLMQEEAEEELDESEEEELDESEEEIEEGCMGGDASDDLIDDVEMEEESDINMEDEEEIGGEEEFGDDEGGEEVEISGEEEFGGEEAATKGDILNLEDKLDELMAEFESLMGGDEFGSDEAGDEFGGDGDDFGADEGGDAIATDDTEEMLPMAEAISLKAAPKPTTSEEGSINKKSPTTFNSGATGMAASPVKPTGTEAKGRPNPTTKDLGVAGPQDAGKGAFKSAAPKPVTTQASGVNTRSPLAKG